QFGAVMRQVQSEQRQQGLAGLDAQQSTAFPNRARRRRREDSRRAVGRLRTLATTDQSGIRDNYRSGGMGPILGDGGILKTCVLAERKKVAYPAGDLETFSSAGPTRAGRIRHERDYDIRQRKTRGGLQRRGSGQLSRTV